MLLLLLLIIIMITIYNVNPLLPSCSVSTKILPTRIMAEYVWKPHRNLLVRTKPISGLNLLACA